MSNHAIMLPRMHDDRSPNKGLQWNLYNMAGWGNTVMRCSDQYQAVNQPSLDSRHVVYARDSMARSTLSAICSGLLCYQARHRLQLSIDNSGTVWKRALVCQTVVFAIR